MVIIFVIIIVISIVILIAQKVHDMSTVHSAGRQAASKDVWAVNLEL